MDGIKKMMQLAVDARGEKGGVERKNGKESGKGSASKKAEAEEEKKSTSQHARSADSGRVEEDESVDGASSTMSLIGVEVEDVQRELDSLCEAVEGMQNETAEMGAAKEGRKKQAGKGRGESSRAAAKASSSSSHLQHVQTLSSGKTFSMPAVGGNARLQRGGGMRESRIEEKSEEEEGGAGKVQSRHVHGSVRARGQRHSSAGSDGDDSGSDGEVEERQQERGSRSEEEGEEEEGEDRVVGPVWRRRTGNIVLPASVPSVKRKRGGKKSGWTPSYSPVGEDGAREGDIYYAARQERGAAWRKGRAELDARSITSSAASDTSEGGEEDVLDTDALREELKKTLQH
mmetsp:Transcript_25519/g.63911  ORF Transcript_25519/g.63911 Transcript_25519/m.63911 type:complete len:345 (+) Transcript_25519:1518-2552(+)